MIDIWVKNNWKKFTLLKQENLRIWRILFSKVKIWINLKITNLTLHELLYKIKARFQILKTEYLNNQFTFLSVIQIINKNFSKVSMIEEIKINKQIKLNLALKIVSKLFLKTFNLLKIWQHNSKKNNYKFQFCKKRMNSYKMKQ